MTQHSLQDFLIRARDLYLNNVFSLTKYSYEDAMIEAGISRAIASDASNQKLVESKVREKTKGNPPSFDMSIESKSQRFLNLYRILYDPEKKKPCVVDLMKRAGYAERPEIYRVYNVQSKHYARCIRATAGIRAEVEKELNRNVKFKFTDSDLEVQVLAAVKSLALVDENELTLEEKQCAEMLRELDLADQQGEDSGEEEGRDDE